MIIIGDSDGTRPEHAVEMFRLRGGGVFGDLYWLRRRPVQLQIVGHLARKLQRECEVWWRLAVPVAHGRLSRQGVERGVDLDGVEDLA